MSNLGRPHFQLYHCKEDNHYHIITGQDNAISWPFWSRDTGLKLVDFLKGVTPLKEKKWASNELERMKEEITTRSMIRNRDERGRFKNGFFMPRGSQYREGNVATYWINFQKGKNSQAYYITMDPLGTFLLPLYCDFVRRKETKPISARSQKGWEKLAVAPVEFISMKELGIVLQ